MSHLAKMPAARGWRQSAACRDKDPDLFFPVGPEGPAAVQAEEARAVCAGCPVRLECLDWALSHSVGYGIWGGVTEQERAVPASAALRLCASGRHLRSGPGQCLDCKREKDREREPARDRDQAAIYARRLVLRAASREDAA